MARTGLGGSLPSFIKVVLDVVWYVGIAGATLSLVLLTIVAVTQGVSESALTLPVSFAVDAAAYPVTGQSAGADQAQVVEASGMLRIMGPELAPLLLFLGVGAVSAAVFLAVVYQLRKVFATLAAGTPFIRANANRIRFIGAAVLVGEAARTLLFYMTSAYASDSFSAPGLTFRTELPLNLSMVLAGLLVLAIAEVFRRGAELQEDQDLTV